MQKIRAKVVATAFVAVFALQGGIASAACTMQLRTECANWDWYEFTCEVYHTVNSHCAGVCDDKGTPVCFTITNTAGQATGCECV
ncbi:hypothetical protein GC173_12875 [bacterium]|nr:hypothetical protein [bacterium]